MCTFPFYFIHSLGCFLTTLNLHVQILKVFFYWSGVRWDQTCCEDLEFLYLVWYSCLHFIPVVSVVFLFYIIASRYFIPYSYYYHVWTLIRSIAMMVIHFSRFLYLVQVILGLACIRGVFSSRIYVADSRHDSIFHVFWEARRDILHHATYFEKRGVTFFTMQVYFPMAIPNENELRVNFDGGVARIKTWCPFVLGQDTWSILVWFLREI